MLNSAGVPIGGEECHGTIPSIFGDGLLVQMLMCTNPERDLHAPSQPALCAPVATRQASAAQSSRCGAVSLDSTPVSLLVGTLRSCKDFREVWFQVGAAHQEPVDVRHLAELLAVTWAHGSTVEDSHRICHSGTLLLPDQPSHLKMRLLCLQRGCNDPGSDRPTRDREQRTANATCEGTQARTLLQSRNEPLGAT